MSASEKRPKGLLPPHVFLASTILIITAGYLETGRGASFNWGAILVIVAFIIAAWAARQFKKAETTIYPGRDANTLVKSGPFAYSRNPMYLGMFFALCGFWVGTQAISPLPIVVAFPIIIQNRFIEKEEANLERLFGEDYSTYKSKVRRWL